MYTFLAYPELSIFSQHHRRNDYPIESEYQGVWGCGYFIDNILRDSAAFKRQESCAGCSVYSKVYSDKISQSLLLYPDSIAD